MKTIYKYIVTGNPIEIYKDAVIVHCNKQDSYHCFWALVNTNNPLELRHFDVVGTGWALVDDMHHVGTFLEGHYVWHVVERK